ncbi:MAG TPA: aldehyde dehydrogenase family protein [Acholeplasmatales bacterium]|nr:MAG: aldehyde dehydrogenase [Tenericutes bacterium GWF2_57_13]HAQ55883.1 aldehyde dehydrogenase family protein [Acholeplasmatales bacterium]
MDISKIVADQRAYFESGKTKDVAFRIACLKKLATAIKSNEPLIEAALKADLNKHRHETYLTETGIVLSEITHMIHHLKRWSRPRHAKTPIQLFAARSRVYREPHGVVLIMSPWNYPFQLAIDPLVGAIAGGNCAVVKPGSYAPETAKAIAVVIAETFDPGHVTTVLGGRAENTLLLDQHFDYIFFTGSQDVGKTVMAKAAEHLTPVSLELGGKSPCILAEGANLKLAARRIAFGKTVNAGQTCVAPDYLLIREADKAAFVGHFKDAIASFFGPDPLQNDEYPKIINQKHHTRLLGLLQGMNAVVGGTSDATKIAPTVLDGVRPEDAIMQEEIFGPILPMLTYQSIDEAIAFINRRPRPLALYLFTNQKAIERSVIDAVSFGGATLNDTLMHVASSEIGFGGVGASGMGSYHGRYSFDTFTHAKPVLKRYNWIDLDIRYHPYTKRKQAVTRAMLK